MKPDRAAQEFLQDEINGEIDVPMSARQLNSWHRTFLLMSICFGLTHATATVCVAYASCVLGSSVGQLSDATLYVGCVLSALFLGPVVDSSIGPKWGLVIGMLGDVIYLCCFGMATSLRNDAMIQWTLAILGALFGGFGAGLMWTCQGSFFSIVTDAIDGISDRPRDEISMQLSSVFAFYFLGQECLWSIVVAVLLENLKVGDTVAFLGFAALGALGTVILAFSKDVTRNRLHLRGPPCSEASAALRLLPDPRLWLISFTTLAFGFSCSWINGYVNRTWVPRAMGSRHLIGYASALCAGVAAVSSSIYAKISACVGGKVVALLLGSTAFLGIAGMSLITAPHGDGPGGWHFGVLAFHVCMGIGRGSYEGINKSVFVDFFTEGKAVGAFANMMVLSTLASAIGFVLGAGQVNMVQIILICIVSVLVCPCYCLATRIQRSRARG